MEKYLVFILLAIFHTQLATPVLGCESNSADCDDRSSVVVIVVVAVGLGMFICIFVVPILCVKCGAWKFCRDHCHAWGNVAVGRYAGGCFGGGYVVGGGGGGDGGC